MVDVIFNGTVQSYNTFEEFVPALDRFDSEPQFELCISAQSGQSLSMLRNNDHAWLMYVRFNGDSGLVTRGDKRSDGVCRYKLANGQVDEYPLSWCIDLEQCFKALAYFVVNDGAQYSFVEWQEA